MSRIFFLVSCEIIRCMNAFLLHALACVYMVWSLAASQGVLTLHNNKRLAPSSPGEPLQQLLKRYTYDVFSRIYVRRQFSFRLFVCQGRH